MTGVEYTEKMNFKNIFPRITLPGSAEGIKYYLKPDFDAIYKSEVWVDGECTLECFF